MWSPTVLVGLLAGAVSTALLFSPSPDERRGRRVWASHLVLLLLLAAAIATKNLPAVILVVVAYGFVPVVLLHPRPFGGREVVSMANFAASSTLVFGLVVTACEVLGGLQEMSSGAGFRLFRGKWIRPISVIVFVLCVEILLKAIGILSGEFKPRDNQLVLNRVVPLSCWAAIACLVSAVVVAMLPRTSVGGLMALVPQLLAGMSSGFAASWLPSRLRQTSRTQTYIADGWRGTVAFGAENFALYEVGLSFMLLAGVAWFISSQLLD